MKKIRFAFMGVCLVMLTVVSSGPAFGKGVVGFGQEAVARALEILEIAPGSDGLALITNAGYALYNGQSSRRILDIAHDRAGVSLGRNTLLQVHSSDDATLFLAFLHKRNKTDIQATVVKAQGNSVTATDPVNLYVGKGQSFKGFETLWGKQAFSIVTLANGWAQGIPEDLLQGALFHDHFCCGVATGYFTARYIKERLPLSEGAAYTYVGIPAWCQDDYIMHHLNLTPGKGGYYAMNYPWDRPWKTAGKTYSSLGGIIITFDRAANRGEARVLAFDWHFDEFMAASGLSPQPLDWKNSPWLHVLYNRFLLEHRDHPEKFVSVLGVKQLNNREEYMELVGAGENPLEAILGRDQDWRP
jgi:formylmethanofuran dehydrogenase subunit E-like metal-binding protein